MMMAMTSSQHYFGQTAWSLTTGPTNFTSRPEAYKHNCLLVQVLPELLSEFEAPCGGHRPAAQVGCRERRRASFVEDGMTAEELQEFLWKNFFTDPSQWWDNRRSKKTSRHPDFKHKKTKHNLWLTDWHKPAWVDSQLARWDAGLWRRPPPGALVVSISSDQGACTSQGGPAAVHKDEYLLEVCRCKMLCEEGQVTEAVDALHHLVQQGCHVPNNLFYHVLKGCMAKKDLSLGRRLHALAITKGYEGNAFLCTHFIGMYASHGSLDEAMQVFSEVAEPSAQNWASIIFAYARHGKPAQAIGLYQQMRRSTLQPDSRIFVAVLKACATARDLATGKDVHAQILAQSRADVFVLTCLVDMYAKCGNLEDARRVFDTMLHKSVVTWTAMIAGYTQHGRGKEALSLYHSMRKECVTPPNSVTFTCLLQACANVGVVALQQGRQLHAQIEKQGLQNDAVLGASLINMYGKCGSAENAQTIFDRLPAKDVVTWTAMITAYAQQGMGQKSLRLYSRMLQDGLASPDAVAFVCLLQACASVGVGALHQGKQLHAQVEDRQLLQNDALVGASLVSMYGKCGSAKNARRVFDGLSQKNVVTWNAMIAGYVQQGMAQKALALYSCMQQDHFVVPNAVTYVSLLQACASIAALPLGKQLHAQIEKQALQTDVVVGAGLVNMYAKCGSVEEAHHIFNSLAVKDIVAWSAIIAGYTTQGDSRNVFLLVERMKQEGIQPNSITFLSLLTVCNHAGLVDKGRNYFKAMVTNHGISPSIEHYTCMMDLLGRAGHLDEALQIAKTMPFRPSGAMWLSLLGSCRKWSNIEIGEQAFEFAVTADQENAASYLLMSSIYAEAQMWDKEKEVQAKRLKFAAGKQPGQTWATDISGVVHSFVVGYRNEHECEGIPFKY